MTALQRVAELSLAMAAGKPVVARAGTADGAVREVLARLQPAR